MAAKQTETESAYLNLLTKTAQDSQSDYDKAALTLSGGALGVSIAFVKDIIGSNAGRHCWLMAAWLPWGISCASVLVSYYTSARAHRKEIADFDADPSGNRSFSLSDSFTNILNGLSGGCFVLGLFCFCWFAAGNLSGRMERPHQPQPPFDKVEKGQPLLPRPAPQPSPIVNPNVPPPAPREPEKQQR